MVGVLWRCGCGVVAMWLLQCLCNEVEGCYLESGCCYFIVGCGFGMVARWPVEWWLLYRVHVCTSWYYCRVWLRCACGVLRY